MNIKLISAKKTKQSVKLQVIVECVRVFKKIEFEEYKYNNNTCFFFKSSFKDSKIILNVILSSNINIKNTKLFLGSFIFDHSVKYSANDIIIACPNKEIADTILLEFYQKDFIYNKYLTGANSTKFKIQKFKHSNLLQSINFLKTLVSEPSNFLYPESFAKLINHEINKKRVKVKVSNKKQIEKVGLRCLLSVNQGSDREPRMIEFSNKKRNVDILFVGKGVCFDTGGISLKPSSGMEDMKWDMAGAAVVSAIIKYLSNINTNLSYAGIIGLVENMPDGKSYKPGDIIKSYKGINVEVLNTDAEGRLVLADIIAYGCDIYKPKIVIDFATLTGAIMVALGQHYAGMYSNDEELANSLYISGLNTNEKVWRMPLHYDFDEELNSPFVDLKNITNSRYGGSVTAAQFLQRFIPEDTKWVHLDIAGVTWKPNGDRMNSKGATGFGLTLIADFIDKYF